MGALGRGADRMATQILTIKAGDHVLDRFANGLGALGEQRAKQVIARGLNRAGNPALTAVRRALVKRTSAPLALVKKQVYARKAWAGDEGGAGKLQFEIVAFGRPIPLRDFKPVEFKFGVRAKVWGRFQRFDGAFMRGGLWPNRVGLNLGDKVFVRETNRRLPIKQVFGPSLPKELIKPEIVKVFTARADTLGDAIAHELDRELSKFS